MPTFCIQSLGLDPTQVLVYKQYLHSKGVQLYRHVEMLRDDMGILKKELLQARGQVAEATSITGNIDGRFHLLESEMSGVWKKLQEEAIRPRSNKGNQGQTKVQVCQERAGKRYIAFCN